MALSRHAARGLIGPLIGPKQTSLIDFGDSRGLASPAQTSNGAALWHAHETLLDTATPLSPLDFSEWGSRDFSADVAQHGSSVGSLKVVCKLGFKYQSGAERSLRQNKRFGAIQ